MSYVLIHKQLMRHFDSCQIDSLSILTCYIIYGIKIWIHEISVSQISNCQLQCSYVISFLHASICNTGNFHCMVYYCNICLNDGTKFEWWNLLFFSISYWQKVCISWKFSGFIHPWKFQLMKILLFYSIWNTILQSYWKVSLHVRKRHE